MSWNYYVAGGDEPDCEDGAMTCDADRQSYDKPGFWNVLPWFDDREEGQRSRQHPGHLANQFYTPT